MGVDWLRDRIREVPDYPQAGVSFKDITPLLADADAFAACVDALSEPFASHGVDKVIGIEARGFIVAAPVALRLGAGFVPLRKPGKLPWEIERQDYVLEYSSNTLEVHRDALQPGESVLVVDDVLATGGTAEAALQLVERLGAKTVGFACIVELGFLGGRRKLEGLEMVSLVEYV